MVLTASMTSKRVTPAALAAVMAVTAGETLPIEKEPIMTQKKTIMTSPPDTTPSATSLGPYLQRKEVKNSLETMRNKSKSKQHALL